ncbi:MAG: hypothetical protein LBN21_02280 [Treponema sp.]|nr:hypothetical protein [Treponema sp.]
MAIVPVLYAGGKPDQALSRADTLIGEKQYDQAIQILTDFMKRNPDRFDQAQVRLKRIVNIRGEFNSIADELLDTVVNEPGNVEKILALTTRLEELESAGNPGVQSFIARTRALAQFNYNRDRLERILAEGRILIDQGNFQGALTAYAGGLDLYLSDFYEAGYGEVVENRVNRGIADINSGIEAFPAITRPLNDIAAEITRAGQQNAPVIQVEAIYNRMVPSLDRIISFQSILYETAGYFDDQLAQFQQADSTLGDRSFLSFASRLIRGRTGEPVQEGMLGAVEGYWNSVVLRAETTVAALADQNYAAGMSAVNSGEYTASRNRFETTAGYLKYPVALIEKRRELTAGGNPPVRFLFGESVVEEKAGEFLKYQSMNQTASYLIAAADLGNQYSQSIRTESHTVESWLNGTTGADAAMLQETQIRQNAASLAGRIDALLADIAAGTENLRNFDEPDILVYADDAQSVAASLRSLTASRERLSAIRYYTIADGELAKHLNSRRSEFEEGNALVQGISGSAAGEGPAAVEHYPTEGLAILARMDQAIIENIRTGNELLTRYRGEQGAILDGGEIEALQVQTQNTIRDITALRTRGQGIAAAARTQIAQAETFRFDGDRLFREAQAALTRNDFDTARDRLQRATERFNASLGIQETQSLRTEWDTRLVALGNDITRIENEIVVRDVRELVNSARSSYFAGNFERAEDQLVRAQNRWRRTNVGDDTEVQYWLRLVRGALSLQSGRTIPATAPLYPEMSQLLSEAKKNYDEGVRLFNAGRRQEGIARFNEARRKLDDVKLMFPLNQEAGILILRMDQVTDPGAFDASFQTRLNEAISGTKGTSTRRNRIEAFADLQDLAEINPRYPRIQNVIAQAEIDVGLRPPPPNPRDLARSVELTAAAQRIMDGNIRAQFEVAMAQLDEAITLNPSNAQATRIKDWIQTQMGGGDTSILDSNSEAEYQRAVREYQQGNNFTALAIVQQLLQIPRNRSSSKVLELQKRIQSIL